MWVGLIIFEIFTCALFLFSKVMKYVQKEALEKTDRKRRFISRKCYNLIVHSQVSFGSVNFYLKQNI